MSEDNEPAQLIDYSGRVKKLNSREDAQEVIDIIKANPKATAIKLGGNSIGSEAAAAISEALADLSDIENADLGDIFTGRLRAELPIALAHLCGALKNHPKLRFLNLSDNAYGKDGAQSFVDLLRTSKSLRSLWVNNNGLGITGGTLVAETLQGDDHYEPSRLECIVVGRNRLEDPGAKAFSKAFSKMGTLVEIRMFQNGIGEEGVEAIAKSLSNNKNLEVLDLNDNKVKKSGAKALAEVLPSLHKLRELNLGDCMIGSKGVILLTHALEHLTGLEKLDLTYNDVDDAAMAELVKILRKNPNLKQLELNGNKLQESGMNMLKDLLEELGKSDILGSMSDNEDESGSDFEDEDEDVDALASDVQKVSI